MLNWFKKNVQVPEWQQHPYRIGKVASGRTVLVIGATSRAGRKLCRSLIDQGDRLIVLVRDKKKATDIFGPHAIIITSLDALGRGIPIDKVITVAGHWFESFSRQMLAGRTAKTLPGRKGSSSAMMSWTAPFI